jgi:hypothetical protein
VGTRVARQVRLELLIWVKCSSEPLHFLYLQYCFLLHCECENFAICLRIPGSCDILQFAYRNGFKENLAMNKKFTFKFPLIVISFYWNKETALTGVTTVFFILSFFLLTNFRSLLFLSKSYS